MSHIDDIYRYFTESELSAVRKWRKGEFLCREGSELPMLHFQLSGKFRVFRTLSNGREMLYRIYLPKSVIGDIEVFSGGEEASCSVQCVENAETLALPIRELREHPESAPELIFLLGRGIARKLHENSVSEALNTVYPLEVRLAHYYLTFSDPGLCASSLVQLADWMGCSYRHLGRCLRSLHLQGAIEKTPAGWEPGSRSKLEYFAGPMLEEEKGRTLFEGINEQSSSP